MTYTPHILMEIFDNLHTYFGPMNWWPGETPFEIVIGAILTQNTAWSNVEKAICNLKKNNLLMPETMADLTHDELAAIIRPSGYYNIKTKRIKSFLSRLISRHNGSLDILFSLNKEELRYELLTISGIGPETADSIMLYAAKYPIFVVDAYTRRFLMRHNLLCGDEDYYQIQEFFQDNLAEDVPLYNEFHALIVNLGKEFCRAKKPLCHLCPLKDVLNEPDPDI